jgi:hypothetical protein
LKITTTLRNATNLNVIRVSVYISDSGGGGVKERVMETGSEGGALIVGKEEGSETGSNVQVGENTPTHQEKVLSSGIQLRTSARVSKKLRSDQEANAAAAAAAEKKCEPIFFFQSLSLCFVQ